MTGKGKTCIAVLAVAAIGACIFISNAYFFNPLLFRKSGVTYLPWSWYKKPLQIEYFVLDEGWKSTKSTDTREIRQFFAELHKGLGQSSGVTNEQGRAAVWVAVRRMNDGVVLLALKGYEDGKQFVIQNNVPVQLSDELQMLLQERLADARRAAVSASR